VTYFQIRPALVLRWHCVPPLITSFREILRLTLIEINAIVTAFRADTQRNLARRIWRD
jgi:hypothetical protein